MRGFLHLEDGVVFEGELSGSRTEADGEVVFTTGMTGYPESLTDPSFAGQILVFTYPLIGNYGVPEDEPFAPQVSGLFESGRIWVRGAVVSQVTSPSHYQSAMALDAWLRKHKVPILTGIDTRSLTQKLRENGTLRGSIRTSRHGVSWKPQAEEPLVPLVSIDNPITYDAASVHAKHIVLIDCGVKHGIIRALVSAGFRVTRVPYDTDPMTVDAVDGIICSNGPGDPKDCRKTVGHIQKAVAAGIPFLGICLGHQLLALAIGADTYKLPYGHRGLNQPCMDRRSGKAYITSQNHGYAVDKKTIPHGFSEWFVNLNDGTNEGMVSKSGKIRSTQFHPEGHPGPFDTEWVFTQFYDTI